LASAGNSVRYFSAQNLQGFQRRVYNATGGLVSSSSPALTVSGTGQSIYTYESNNGGSMPFVTPIATNSVVGNRLIVSSSRRLYESTDGGTTLTLLNSDLSGGTNLGASAGRNAIVAGGRLGGANDANILWAGVGSNLLLRSVAGGLLTRIATYAGGSIDAITTNLEDWRDAFITDGNAVFRTTNAGGSMTTLTGNLFTLLGSESESIYDLAYISDVAEPFVAAGTRRGMFRMNLSNLGVWTEWGTGVFPNVLVYSLDYDPLDKLLIAGTMGRGAWRISVNPIPEPTTLVSAGFGLALVLAFRRRRRD
jgi:hypothetical protein